jgi:DNA relaxase NicK
MPPSTGPRIPGVVTRLETGIDWLSATLHAGHSLSGKTYSTAMDFLEHQQSLGNTPKEAVLLGYKGVICGKCFVGERDDGILLRGTGGVSTSFFEAIATADLHVSRLDLQVTVWLTGSEGHVGRIARNDAAYFRHSHPKEAKRRITTIESEDGGYTLYIGSKSSEHYCRLYDKEAESSNEYYKGAWRYEVELHNDAATTAARYLLGNSLQLETITASTVRQYYQARGVQVPWYTQEELNALRPAAVLESDDARSLKWLAQQVKPTVARLMRNGYTASVLEALGVEPPLGEEHD